MNTCFLLGIAATLVSAARGACDACIDGRCLRKHSLPDNTGGLFDINRNTDVYYAVTRKSDQHYITQCNLNTLTCNDTAVPWDLWDITVDQRTGDLYATGSGKKGLYKLDLIKNGRVLLVDEAEEMSYMRFKDKLYYAPKKGGIYTYDGGISLIVPGTEGYIISEFFFDKNGRIYFRDRKNGRPHIRKLEKGTATETDFTGAMNRPSPDKDGNVIVLNVVTYNVYRVTNDELVAIGAVTEWVYGITFDGYNNLIFTVDEKKRYYLKEATEMQCSVEQNGLLGQNFRQFITETPRKNLSDDSNTNH